MSLTAPTVTGYSPFWSNVLSPNQPQGGTYSMDAAKARAKAAYHVARMFKKRGMADARGALAVLIGAVSGTTADVHYNRVAAPTGPDTTVPVATGVGALGGSRTIETVYSINRASTAADITELKKWFSPTALLEAGITYPTTTGNSLSSGMQVGGTGRF
jgi:hypothetical protein